MKYSLFTLFSHVIIGESNFIFEIKSAYKWINEKNISVYDFKRFELNLSNFGFFVPPIK